MTPTTQILLGDCRHTLLKIPEQSVQCCITSPPYWGLRSYLPKDHPDKPLEIGQEKTPDEYVATMVRVFSGIWNVLKDNGVVWLNLGDSYFGGGRGGNPAKSKHRKQATNVGSLVAPSATPKGCKPKDLVGLPWLVAFALRSAGWYLRSDIIWAKPNCMPESVSDRPTRSHEYIFLLTKKPRYYYDASAIKEPSVYDVDGTGTAARKARASEELKSHPDGLRNGIRNAGFKDAAKFDGKNGDKQRGHSRRHASFNDRWDLMTKKEQCTGMRNKRDVWTVPPALYAESHFATFPPELIKPCVLAGSRPGDTILDPFAGSGTVGEVALQYGRSFIGCELNTDYLKFIEQRTKQPGLILK